MRHFEINVIPSNAAELGDANRRFTMAPSPISSSSARCRSSRTTRCGRWVDLVARHQHQLQLCDNVGSFDSRKSRIGQAMLVVYVQHWHCVALDYNVMPCLADICVCAQIAKIGHDAFVWKAVLASMRCERLK